MGKIYIRKTKEYIECVEGNSKELNFLYNTICGRILLKIMVSPAISNLYACYIKSRFSKHKIKKFIENYSINVSEYKEKSYKSFNEFFIRERKKISFDKDDDVLISVADSKLLYFEITEDLNLRIKNSNYGIEELLKNKEIADKYAGGICLINRLSVNDYHRYHYFDDGIRGEGKKINGILHTVRPIAHKKYKVFAENTREWTLLHTKNFGDVVQIEVGALLVGRINNHINNKIFSKGDEKGYFSYGGSTIILLFEKDKVLIDRDIISNSKEYIETIVRVGEKIGVKKNL